MSAPSETPPLQISDLFAMVLRRRLVATISAVAMALLVLVAPSLLMPPLYRAEAALSLGRNAKPVAFTPDAAGDEIPDQLVNTQRELLESRAVLSSALTMGGLQSSPSYARAKDPVALLQSRLRSSVARNSWVITVSLDDEDPVRAEAGLRSVIDAFIARRATQARERRSADGAFIDQRLAEADRKLQAARAAERKFREANHIASIDPDNNHITARIRGVAESQARLDEQIAVSGALIKQLRTADAIPDQRQRLSAYLRIDTISTFTVVGSLQKDLYTLEGEEAELAAKYLDKHPKLIEVRSHVAAKRAQLEETIAAARTAIIADDQRLADQRTALVAAQEALQGELDAYRQHLIELQRLVQESAAHQKVVDELQNRSAQLAALADLDERQITLDSPPASSPIARGLGPAPLILLALIAATAAAIAGAAVVDSIDRSIRTSVQLRTQTGLRLLAELPACPLLQPLCATGPGSPPELAEAVRALWTGLRFAMGQAQGCRVILVCSPSESDGRSTVAARLAAGAAMAGGRALLVDADLRLPSQSAQLGVSQVRGLAQLLAGEPEIAPATTPIPNLELMPSGPPPTNPGELLNSHCLGEWLAQMRSHYDVIVVDCPALAGSSDALLLADHADGVLLLARAGSTLREQLREAWDRLTPLHAKVLGCAMVRAG